jgi:diguanylate cyclase (GGDEF)-like protein
MSVIPRTLRFRVAVTLLVAFILSAGAFIMAIDHIVETNFRAIETSALTRDVDRARAAVEQQVRLVDDIANELAGRNDVAAQPLTTSELRALGLDFAVFSDVRGSVGWEVAGEDVGTAPSESAATVASNGSVHGLLVLPGGPAAVSSVALPVGDLFVGSYLTPHQPAVSALTLSSVELVAPSDAVSSSIPPGPHGTEELSEDLNLGWTTLSGIDGHPALIVAVREPRPVMAQAVAIERYIQVGVSLLSLLVALSIILMLEGSVLHRLGRLRRSVIEFPDDAASLDPITRQRPDEIGDLAVAFHDTLGKIKASEEEHKHDARHDHLTGLANRRGLLEDAERLLAGCEPDGEVCCALVLLDLDEFKRINDELGHQVGDEVLVWFADHMRKALRSDSTLCRLGGDEFAVLMPHTTRDEAVVAVERLRDATTREDDNPCFGMFEVHFSVGYAIAPDHGETLEMLFQCADTDLYANKRGKSESTAEELESA